MTSLPRFNTMHPRRRTTIAHLAACMALAGLTGWPRAGSAQILADPAAPGSQRPTVLTAPNRVPLVQITTPSAAGVSRNTYGQFDIGAPGAILNNSRTEAATQLGGWANSPSRPSSRPIGHRRASSTRSPRRSSWARRA